MPGRTIPLVNDHYYHIFNRGSDKRDLFIKSQDYKRFVQTFSYYQTLGPKPRFSLLTKNRLNSWVPDSDKKLVEIIAYCLMPNHFHFLVRQLKENGISLFLGQLTNSYTKYFNTKYHRVGPLLQGSFKSVMVESDEQLIHLSRYIHLNPVVSGLTNKLEHYMWSSFPEYLAQPILCSTREVLNLFSSPNDYLKFVEDQIDYGISLELLKHKALDLEG